MLLENIIKKATIDEVSVKKINLVYTVNEINTATQNELYGLPGKFPLFGTIVCQCRL